MKVVSQIRKTDLTSETGNIKNPGNIKNNPNLSISQL